MEMPNISLGPIRNFYNNNLQTFWRKMQASLNRINVFLLIRVKYNKFWRFPFFILSPPSPRSYKFTFIHNIYKFRRKAWEKVFRKLCSSPHAVMCRFQGLSRFCFMWLNLQLKYFYQNKIAYSISLCETLFLAR